jgi:hypothetical protein
MRLGLSNVLQIPILVLSTRNLVPFTEIYPQTSVGIGEAILLKYNHVGPGHYDALVHRTQQDELDALNRMNSIRSDCRKWCFRASNFKIVSGEHAPGPH